MKPQALDAQRKDHVNGLDGMRAIAAFAVVTTHVGFNSGRSLRSGGLGPWLARFDFGVTIFFLLSGFLLFRPFARALLTGDTLPAVGAFWWRRLVRILPAYWLAVVVTLGALSDRPASGGDWLAYLTLTQTYTGHNVDPSLTQMWTLATELAFYALLPLLAVGCRRAARRWSAGRCLTVLLAVLFGIALAVIVLIHAIVGSATASLLWLPVYLDWFALGMGLAVVSVLPAGANPIADTLRRWASAAPGTCLVFGVVVFWFATSPVGGPYDLTPASGWQWATRHVAYGLAAFLLLLPVALGRNRMIQRTLGSRVGRWLGTVSYGVYLWHLGLLLVIQRWLGWSTFSGHFAPLLVLTVVAATVAAAASWYLLERPLLNRLTGTWRRSARRERAGQERGESREHEALDAGAPR